jgi:hypothetical protein
MPVVVEAARMDRVPEKYRQRLQHLVDQHADVDDCAAQLRIVFARRLQLSTTCCDEYGASERATLLC